MSSLTLWAVGVCHQDPVRTEWISSNPAHMQADPGQGRIISRKVCNTCSFYHIHCEISLCIYISTSRSLYDHQVHRCQQGISKISLKFPYNLTIFPLFSRHLFTGPRVYTTCPSWPLSPKYSGFFWTHGYSCPRPSWSCPPRSSASFSRANSPRFSPPPSSSQPGSARSGRQPARASGRRARPA